MQYLLLIYDNETRMAAMTEAEQTKVMSDYRAYNEYLTAAGIFVGGDALQGTPTATSVRLRDGQVLNTDGPFAETKEQLGGYYLLECANLDQALEAASRCPTAKHGTIEVRPIMDWSKENG